MRVAWINGWSLSQAHLRRLAVEFFPESDHIALSPVPGWDQEVEALERIDVLIGYSLGAFLLMGRPELKGVASRTILLAPFEDFRSESDCGGRVGRGQLVYLSRWLDREAMAAIADFRVRSGLAEPLNDDSEYSLDNLKWGIERLMTDSVESGSIDKFECYVGSEDTLLDSSILKKLYPRINVIEGAGHDLKELLGSGRVSI